MKTVFPIAVVGAILASIVAGLLVAAEPAQPDRPAVQRITLAQIRVGRDVGDNLSRIRAALPRPRKTEPSGSCFPKAP
jgi:hypothetical protein